MKSDSESGRLAELPKQVGKAAVADKRGYFTGPVEPGAVVVVDVPDLGFELGQSLAAAKPVAVLNASPSKTGRQPATGTRALLEAGVLVVDDLGPDILRVEEDQEVVLGDEMIRFGDTALTQGRVVTVADLESSQDRMRLAARIESYALSTWNSFESESDLVMDGVGLPNLESFFSGRVVAVFGPASTEEDLPKKLKTLANYRPVIVGVGVGAAQLARAKAKVDVVVGDPREIPAPLLHKAKAVIAVGHKDPEVTALLKQHAVASHQVSTSLSDFDVALLTANFSGAELVVDGSESKDVEQYFDRAASKTIASMLTRIEVEDRLVSLDAITSMYRPPISGWYLVALVVSAVVAGASALAFTPLGVSLLEMLINGGSHG